MIEIKLCKIWFSGNDVNEKVETSHEFIASQKLLYNKHVFKKAEHAHSLYLHVLIFEPLIINNLTSKVAGVFVNS